MPLLVEQVVHLSPRVRAVLLGALGLCLAVVCRSATAAAIVSAPPEGTAMTPFSLDRVRLLDGPFKAAMEANTRYLHQLDSDRLLHSFRVVAGLPAPGLPLGGAEAPQPEPNYRGHFLGHYLSACALTCKNTGDHDLLRKAEQIVAELARCQDALGSGFIAAFPESVFDAYERDPSAPRPWTVPYYTLHKTMAGLYDLYTLCGVRQARAVLERMVDYIARRCARLDDAQMQRVLGVEPGGTMELLFNYAALTGKPEHLALARRFRKAWLFDALERGEDPLTGIHANTQIPEVVGMARWHEVTGEPAARQACEHFWRLVNEHRAYATGGSNRGELWGPPDRLADTLGHDNQETCTSYNMLKLTRHLLCWTGDTRYADFYERLLFNGILAAQNPETGLGTYFMPLGPGFAKTFGTPYDSFWCCTGTGVESWAKLAEGIYFHQGDRLYVNLAIASTLDWQEQGVRIELNTRFPSEDYLELKLHSARPRKFTLNLRIPAWTRRPEVQVNGQAVAGGRPGTWLDIEREWGDGDVVRARFPMDLRLQPLPDEPALAALMAGPVVLVGLTESQAPGFLVGDTDSLESWVRRLEGRPLRFAAVNQRKDILFVPLHEVIHEKFAAYWYFVGKAPTGRLRMLRDALDLIARSAEVRPGEEIEEIRKTFAAIKDSPEISRHRDDLLMAMARVEKVAGDPGRVEEILSPLTRPFVPFPYAVKLEPLLPPPDPARVRPYLMVHPAWDGSHERREVGGQTAIVSQRALRKPMIYFRVPDSMPWKRLPCDVRMTIRFHHAGGANPPFVVEYDSAIPEGPYKGAVRATEPIAATGAGWQEVTVLCADALFSGRQNLGADFRIVAAGQEEIAIADVRLEMVRRKVDFSAFEAPHDRVIDRVEPGDEDSEARHALRFERSASGGFAGRRFRHAEGEWSWDLKVLPDRPIVLACVYWGADTGRIFDVMAEGRLIARESLTGTHGARFVRVEYPLPSDLTAGKQSITVRFVNRSGYAGGVFGCWTATEAARK